MDPDSILKCVGKVPEEGCHILINRWIRGQELGCHILINRWIRGQELQALGQDFKVLSKRMMLWTLKMIRIRSRTLRHGQIMDMKMNSKLIK